MIVVEPAWTVPALVVVPEATPKATAQLELAAAEAFAALPMATAWLPCRELVAATCACVQTPSQRRPAGTSTSCAPGSRRASWAADVAKLPTVVCPWPTAALAAAVAAMTALDVALAALCACTDPAGRGGAGPLQSCCSHQQARHWRTCAQGRLCRIGGCGGCLRRTDVSDLCSMALSEAAPRACGSVRLEASPGRTLSRPRSRPEPWRLQGSAAPGWPPAARSVRWRPSRWSHRLCSTPVTGAGGLADQTADGAAPTILHQRGGCCGRRGALSGQGGRQLQAAALRQGGG